MMEKEKLKGIIEALIFVSSKPLSLKELAAIFPDDNIRDIREVIEQLSLDYEQGKGGVLLVEVAGGYQFITRPEYDPYIRKLLMKRKEVRLSSASLETLAIISYRQPVSTPEISAIRGVDVMGPIKNLLEKKLIRITGRKNAPGRPFLYSTTKEFLLKFGLRDLSELPRLEELGELLPDEQKGV
jgi:segregation and condensation protein B